MKRPQTFDITGVIANGRLQISLIYNVHQYCTETIANLGKELKENLLAIIRHCEKKDDSERTASDFTSSDIDNKTLDDIFGELNDELSEA